MRQRFSQVIRKVMHIALERNHVVLNVARQGNVHTARSSLIRLPHSLADFDRRGFRTNRPKARALLQGHATAFLDGFNLAASGWRDVHGALNTVPEYERGFAYEGAAMNAAMRDAFTKGRARAVTRLLDQAGTGYVHLIHVGCGWGLGPVRPGWVLRLPGTRLLRWLALDGAGFAETFFGGRAALVRRVNEQPTERWQARVAGCGRALWFVESGDVAGVAASIAALPASAQPHLWSGIGLAMAYAGGVSTDQLGEVVERCGGHRAALGQGVLFGVAARGRSGLVPAHTRDVCTGLLGLDPAEAVELTEATSRDLLQHGGLTDYLTWKARLRDVVAHDLIERGA